MTLEIIINGVKLTDEQAKLVKDAILNFKAECAGDAETLVALGSKAVENYRVLKQISSIMYAAPVATNSVINKEK